MDDDDVKLPDPNADVANKQLGRSLENLLVSKNRRLLEDLTKIRVSWEELSTAHAKSEQSIELLQNELGRVKELNERLESDLMHMNDLCPALQD
jgi:homeobox protein cut-like